MDNYIEVPYEDTKLFVIKDFDDFLRISFGNYMQLPPVEQRYVHDMHSYFWKDK